MPDQFVPGSEDLFGSYNLYSFGLTKGKSGASHRICWAHDPTGSESSDFKVEIDPDFLWTLTGHGDGGREKCALSYHHMPAHLGKVSPHQEKDNRQNEHARMGNWTIWPGLATRNWGKLISVPFVRQPEPRIRLTAIVDCVPGRTCSWAGTRDNIKVLGTASFLSSTTPSSLHN